MSTESETKRRKKDRQYPLTGRTIVTTSKVSGVKSFQQPYYGLNFNDTWSVVGLSNISKGSDDFNRLGNIINLLSLSFRFTIRHTFETDYIPKAIRVVVIYSPRKDSTPTPSDIFDSQGATVLPFWQTYKPTADFDLIYDKVFTASVPDRPALSDFSDKYDLWLTQSYKAHQMNHDEKDFQFEDTQMTWNGSGSGDWNDHLLMYFCSDLLYADKPKLYFTSTLTFADV